MQSKINIIIIVFFVIPSSLLISQNSEWMQFTCGLNINDIDEEGEFLWIATNGGLVRLNKNTLESEWYGSINSGLPSNSVYAVRIDKNGNKWIGTSQGLVKYDNEKWVVYDTSNSALFNHRIIAIAIDSNNNVWCGTRDCGIAKVIDSQLINIEHNYLGVGEFINWIIVDQIGRIWFALYGKGVIRYDGSEWTDFFDSFVNNEINALAVDKNSTIWISTRGGGYIIPKNSKVVIGLNIYDYQQVINDIIYGISFDVNDNVWFGTDDGLKKYSGTKYYKYQENKTDLPNNDVRHVFIDKDNIKWVATIDGGLVKFDDSTWTVCNTSNSILPHDYVSFINRDINDDMWLYSHYDIVIYDGSHWRKYEVPNPDIAEKINRFITIDGKGNKWFSTDNGTVRFNGSEWIEYDFSNTDMKSTCREVQKVEYVNDTLIWLATYDRLLKFNGHEFTIYDTSDFHASHIGVIAVDSSYNLWFSCYSLASKFDGEHWDRYSASNSELQKSDISEMEVDYNGDIWFGYYDRYSIHSVVSFDGENWSTYDFTNPNCNINANGITSIYCENNGVKWFGLQNWDSNDSRIALGLLKIDNNGLQTFFDISNSGLTSNYIADVCRDKDSNLWIATTGGLIIYREGGVILGIDEYSGYEKKYRESFSSPNPFTNTSKIHFSLTKPEYVQINIYNSFGSKLLTLKDEYMNAGKHYVVFDGELYPSGIYYYTIRIGNNIETGKNIKLR